MSEHEYHEGDRVLVPGVVKGVRDDGFVAVGGVGNRGPQWLPAAMLRPDTGGRDLTADDVRDAHIGAWDDATLIAEHLNRIVRGEDEPLLTFPRDEIGASEGVESYEQPRACAESVPGCTRLRSHTHTPLAVSGPGGGGDAQPGDSDELIATLCDELGVERDELVDTVNQNRVIVMAFDECVREEVERRTAGPLPIMPPEVREALGWFERYPPLTMVLRSGDAGWETRGHAATLVRWLLSVSDNPEGQSRALATDGRSVTGDSAESEQDERVQAAEIPAEYARTYLIGMLDGANEDIADTTPLPEVLDRVSAFVESVTPPADPSPRSWSLPAPPPDDEPLSIYDELEDLSWMDLAAEVARLRAEVAALRDAGNALADRTQDIDDGGDAASEVAAWRSAAGTPTTETENDHA